MQVASPRSEVFRIGCKEVDTVFRVVPLGAFSVKSSQEALDVEKERILTNSVGFLILPLKYVSITFYKSFSKTTKRITMSCGT